MKFSPTLPLSLCLLALPVYSQEKPATITPAAKTTQPTKITPRMAQQMVETVLRETSQIRQLSIKKPVQSGVKSRAALERLMEGYTKDSDSAAEILSAELFMKQLGLAPANFNLQSYYIKMMGEQTAGYYDSKAKKFFTMENVDPLQLRTVMAHELTHALQDQHFDLTRLHKWPKHDSDARFAMKCLVEGDASFTMTRYMTRNPVRAIGVFASALKSSGSSQVFSSGPRLLRESLIFPYRAGMDFVSELHKTGGWDEVSSAFEYLPQSTEQILHIEKYMLGEEPVKVPLRDITQPLGQGWKLIDHDVNGEFGLELVVAEHLKNDTVAKRAAEGWGGDRYSIYRSTRGVLVVQDCVWDSEKDALEWMQAYAKSTSNRFKIKPVPRGRLQVWNAAPNGVWMERRGNRVIILEGKVGAFNPVPVLAALWK